jgi:hypothetical protein
VIARATSGDGGRRGLYPAVSPYPASVASVKLRQISTRAVMSRTLSINDSNRVVMCERVADRASFLPSEPKA